MDGKEAAARFAASKVKSGMTIGLGTGSTATYAIQALSERIAAEGLKISGAPSSERSRALAESLNIPIIELTGPTEIDLTIDGADEVDPDFNLIKGGGGALLREKIVASASREVLIIVDSSKIKPALGGFPLPVAIIPFGMQATLRRLEAFGSSVTLRSDPQSPDQPFTSDDGLHIADVRLNAVTDPAQLERAIKQIVGVAEVGLFIGLATQVIVGHADGRVETLTVNPKSKIIMG